MNQKIKITTIIATVLLILSASTVFADGLFGFIKHRQIDGSGDLITENRELDKFSEIRSKGPLDLYVTCGEDQKVTITIDDNLMEMVEFDVRRGVLEIEIDGSFSADRKARIEISIPWLEAVSIHGSGDIEVFEAESDDLNVEIHGSGDVDLHDLRIEELDISVHGSGDVTAEGSAREIYISIHGSGDIDTRKVEAKEASVKIAGSGDVKVYASENFSGRINGSGDIHVYGDPEHMSRRVSGSGDIRKRR